MGRRWILATVLAIALVACDEEADVEDVTLDPTADAAGEAEGRESGEGEGGEAAPAGEAAEPAEKPQRRFLEVTGSVTLDGNPVEVGAEVPAEAAISTGDDGYAVITLEPKTLIEIRKGSNLTLGASDRRKSSLKLLAGAVWSFMAGTSDYEVVTQNAVAGVRGTVFYVEATSDKKSYICACDGEVEITGLSKKTFKKTPKSSMGHKAFYVNTKKKKDKAKKAKRERHTDEEKDALMKYTAQVE